MTPLPHRLVGVLSPTYPNYLSFRRDAVTTDEVAVEFLPLNYDIMLFKKCFTLTEVFEFPIFFHTVTLQNKLIKCECRRDNRYSSSAVVVSNKTS